MIRESALHTQTLPQVIAGKLTRSILNGEFVTGAKLPSERDLAVQYGTTRNVVREALKRLEAVGLVRVWRGSGIYVQNPQLTAGVELFDALLIRDDGSVNIEFLRDALEFRASVIRLLIRLAAIRRTDAELEQLRELVKERSECREDAQRLMAVSLQLFHEIAYATHNQVCQLMFNTVERVSLRLSSLVDRSALGFDQGQDIFDRIIDAFDRKDQALAELVAIRYIEAVDKAIGLEQAQPSVLHMG